VGRENSFRAALHVSAKTENLLTFSSQPVGYFFVNLSPVANGENPNHSGFVI
jgi:hypothetical protein